jgi:integrase
MGMAFDHGRVLPKPPPLLHNWRRKIASPRQTRVRSSCSPAVTTLHGEIVAYVTARRSRGEIKASTASDLRWTLAGLDRSFGNRPLDQFGPAAIDRWLASIGDLSDATRREYLSRVRGFAQWLLATGKIRTDPTSHVPTIRQARRAPRTLSGEQVAALLRVLPDRRARAIVLLMVGCGCRCAEVAGLRVEDYDRRTITVRGKADHERTLPVPAEVAKAIDAYLDETGVVAGPLIRSQLHPSRGVAPATLSSYVRRWMRDARIKARALDGRSAHALRRTAASDVMDRCRDVRAVQAMLGHERLETTARAYLRPVTIEALREAMSGRTYGAAS